MSANNKRNVSTTRGVKGGYAFSAPVGTAGAPTSTNYRPSEWLTNGEPPAGWECLGYIPTDGLVESASSDGGEAIRDINLDSIDETESSTSETLKFSLMELKGHTLGTEYGHQNVTDENGTIVVAHNWAKASERYQYVFLLVLKDERYLTKYIPDGKISERGDVTYNKTTVAQREVTVTYLTDEDGNGCFDFIDSTETPAPQLSALSMTGGTLSPTFAAGTTAYTATASGSSVTVTATAGTGKTVSIKCGENTYSSGSSIPVVAGTNKIVVTVTHTESGAKGTYTITVTKS